MAIKTVENTFDPDHLDTLLCEIKVLATLDKHIHLVNMLASCSSQVDIGKIWLLLEFCSSGNLKSFLINHRKEFVENIKSKILSIVLMRRFS